MIKTCLITIILLLTLLVSTPGCSSVDKYQEKREVMSSINDLKDDDPEIRLKAIENLPRYVDYHELVVPALIDAIQDEDPEVRLEAVKSFSHHDGDQDLIVPALVDAIQDEDPRVRKHALGNLCYFKQKPKIEDVLPTIVDILRDPHEAAEVKCFADLLLGEIGFDANDVDPIVIDLLLEQLRDEDPVLRSGAAIAFIGITSIERAIQPLTEALDDEDPYTRGRAAIALGNIGQGAEHAIPKIIELLNDEELAIRYFATFALKAYGPLAEDAIPAIVEAIVDDRIPIDEGGMAIGSIGQGEDTVEMLIGWLNESEDRKLRLTASKALGFFGSSPGVVDALLQALSDSDAAVRSNAAESLGKTSPVPHVIDALITALDDEDLRVIGAAATSLGEFGTTAYGAIPKLREIGNMRIQFNVQNKDGSFQFSDDYDFFGVVSASNAASDAIDKIEGSGK